MFNLVKKVFGNKKEEKKSSMPSLLERINLNFNTVVYKSQNLNSSWQEQKQQIADLAQDAKKFTYQDDIASAKFEQDILGSITAVSSACDTALAGNDDGSLKKAINSLKSQITQRMGLEK